MLLDVITCYNITITTNEQYFYSFEICTQWETVWPFLLYYMKRLHIAITAQAIKAQCVSMLGSVLWGYKTVN